MKGMTAEDCPLTAPEQSPLLRGYLGGPSPCPSLTERQLLAESLHKGQLDLMVLSLPDPFRGKIVYPLENCTSETPDSGRSGIVESQGEVLDEKWKI